MGARFVVIGPVFLALVGPDYRFMPLVYGQSVRLSSWSPPPRSRGSRFSRPDPEGWDPAGDMLAAVIIRVVLEHRCPKYLIGLTSLH